MKKNLYLVAIAFLISNTAFAVVPAVVGAIRAIQLTNSMVQNQLLLHRAYKLVLSAAQSEQAAAKAALVAKAASGIAMGVVVVNNGYAMTPSSINNGAVSLSSFNGANGIYNITTSTGIFGSSLNLPSTFTAPSTSGLNYSFGSASFGSSGSGFGSGCILRCYSQE